MGGPSAPTAYQPANQAGADASYTQNLNTNTQNNQGLWNYAMPQYQTAVNNVTNNPFNAQAQQGAGQVAQAGQGVGQDQLARGQMTSNLAPGIMQSGFDPQSANYNWNLGQTLNSLSAQQAQQGTAGSPFASGMAGDATQAFNRNWSMDQQQRQGNAVQQLGQVNASADATQGQGLRTLEGSSQLPANVYQGQQAQTMSALAQFLQAMNGLSAQSTANTAGYGNYMGIGQGATSLDQNAAKINSAGGGLLGGLGSLGGMLGGSGGLLSSITSALGPAAPLADAAMFI